MIHLSIYMLTKLHIQKKASYIKRTAAVLIEKFDGDIPKTVEEMCKDLPGVGQKMAVLTVNIAWNTTVGIGK
jgi:endonuclease III